VGRHALLVATAPVAPSWCNARSSPTERQWTTADRRIRPASRDHTRLVLAQFRTNRGRLAAALTANDWNAFSSEPVALDQWREYRVVLGRRLGSVAWRGIWKAAEDLLAVRRADRHRADAGAARESALRRSERDLPSGLVSRSTWRFTCLPERRANSELCTTVATPMAARRPGFTRARVEAATPSAPIASNQQRSCRWSGSSPAGVVRARIPASRASRCHAPRRDERCGRPEPRSRLGNPTDWRAHLPRRNGASRVAVNVRSSSVRP
jgi:hypothetical protein